MLWNAVTLQVRSAFSPSCLRLSKVPNGLINKEQNAWVTLTDSINTHTHSNCYTHACDPLLVHTINTQIKHAHLCTFSGGSPWVAVFVNWTRCVCMFFLMEQSRGLSPFMIQSSVSAAVSHIRRDHTLWRLNFSTTMESVRGNLHDYWGIKTDWWCIDFKAKHDLWCRSRTLCPP